MCLQSLKGFILPFLETNFSGEMSIESDGHAKTNKRKKEQDYVFYYNSRRFPLKNFASLWS